MYDGAIMCRINEHYANRLFQLRTSAKTQRVSVSTIILAWRQFNN